MIWGRPKGASLSGRLDSETRTHMQKATLREFLRDDSGQAMTEYILVIALVGLPIFLLFKIALVNFLNVFISNIVSAFTRG